MEVRGAAGFALVGRVPKSTVVGHEPFEKGEPLWSIAVVDLLAIERAGQTASLRLTKRAGQPVSSRDLSVTERGGQTAFLQYLMVTERATQSAPARHLLDIERRGQPAFLQDFLIIERTG